MESQPDIHSFPVLENDVLRLEFFEPDHHGERLIEESKNDPKIFEFLTFDPLTSREMLDQWYQSKIGNATDSVLYAVYDKLKHPGAMAGIIGLTETSYKNAGIEIAWVIMFSMFQRTHVTTNACGILLKHCLDPPGKGMGFRRVQWTAHAENEKSIKAAQRLGFEMEGILRWSRVIPRGKPGLDGVFRGSEGHTNREEPGRHSAMLSLCWDDWLTDGKRERLMRMMERR